MDFISLKILDSLPKSEQIAIKKGIIETNDLVDIPVAYLPDSVSTDYYFISYSHLDYKQVYCDIFDLQQNGLSIWYDRGIPAGTSWKETAGRYISTINCKGTIFYISENALKSLPVKDEIKYARNSNKVFLVVYVPSKKNESLFDLIERLYTSKEIDEETYLFFKKNFEKETIYLSLNDPATTKVEKIKSSTPRQDLLKPRLIEGRHKSDNPKCDFLALYISTSNDAFATSIHVDDYFALFDNYEKECEKDLDKLVTFRIYIESAAFANMRSLEYVELPLIDKVVIFDYGFYNCTSLKEFKVITRARSGHPTLSLYKGAFAYCSSLEYFDFENVRLAESCFSGCTSLKEADLSKVDMIRRLTNKAIPESAFFGCESLQKVILPPDVEIISDSAFRGCSSLRTIILPKTVKEIHAFAFAECPNLTVIYDGNGEEFKKIVVDGFVIFTGETLTFKCTDKLFVYKGSKVRVIDIDSDK